MAKHNEHHFSLDDIEQTLDNGVTLGRMIIGRFDDKEAPNVMITIWPPGSTGSIHSHATDYMELVLEGQLTVGRTVYERGDGRIVPANEPYGPLKAGPDGCRILHVFATGHSEPIPAGSAPEVNLYRGNEVLYGNQPGAALGMPSRERASR